ncbi:MAG: leucine-rich repeat protein [Oscillospiraceae bacterium]|nr:leucine-rich repeat protein [Oscillospiraceae bacterium]
MTETAKTVTYRGAEFQPGALLWLGTERTPWRVLEVDREAETALLIAEKPVCEKDYNDQWADTTWEQCSLRAWLNGEYYEKTFSEEEKAAILECELKNPDKPRWGTKGGNDTRDRVFLLSIEEAQKYFKDDRDRAAGSSWWLRSPGLISRLAASVNSDGSICVDVNGRLGVRPALKINLESDLFQSFILSKSPESIIIRVPELYIQDKKVISILSDIKEAMIPESVTNIGESAFSGCSGLTSITLPESVTSIGTSAFSGCTGLTSITIPESVTSIGMNAFSGCTGLTSITLPESVTSIGTSAFRGCSSLTSITLPESVTSIGDGTFMGCSGLMSIMIPESVTSIGMYAFSRCTGLTSITIPESVTSIEMNAFSRCTGLTSITIPEGLRSIGMGAFSGCSGLTSVTLSEGIEELSEGCFSDAKSLKSVQLPSSLKKIGKKAFAGCAQLVSVTGTNGAITYGQDVFYACEKLNYTQEMFRNAGKLCDFFAEHLDVCGTEELAWVILYQRGTVWNNAISKRLNKDSADDILKCMTEHLQGLKKPPKKQVEIAVEFIKSDSPLLTGGAVRGFLDLLREKKLGDMTDSLTADPSVQVLLGEESADRSEERIMPDGSIWYGSITEKLEPGALLSMGTDRRLWRILEVDRQGETALLIAEESVCERAYHSRCEVISWEDCSLRAWLNEEYYDKTFTEKEKAAILECELRNPDNPEYGTRGGNDTRDKIFLLSIEEAEKYFTDDRDRATGTSWWLRSPGYYSINAALVLSDGSIYFIGYGVNLSLAVRPALKINLKSDLFQSFIQKMENGEAASKREPAFIIKSGTLIWADREIREAVLPAYVKAIGAGAFRNCSVLQSITWQGETPQIDKKAFINCPNLALPAAVYTGKKLPADSLAPYIPEDTEVFANILLVSTAKGKYFAAIAEKLTEKNVTAVADVLISRVGKQKIKDPKAVLRFAVAAFPVIGKEKIEKIRDLLREEQVPGTTEWLLSYREDAEPAEPKVTIVRQAFRIPDALLQTEVKAMSGLPSFSHVLAAAGEYAEMYGIGYVDPKEYKKGFLNSYSKKEEADRLAAALNHEALMDVLTEWRKIDGPAWYAPYAVFANDEELTALIDEMKAWEKDKILREQIIRVRGAILLNGTVTAMRYADSLGLLEHYAEMRGTDADSIRDNIISDFGLDENGKRTWTLAGRMITAVLNPDLTLTLQDADGKVLKSVPKKGADPEEYDAVSKEFTDMRKTIRPTAKTRNDKIFADFLSGRTRPGKDWKKAYLGNPVLRMLARLIVWEQDGNTFILDEKGAARDVSGNACEVTDAPVGVAHPMEMSGEAVEAWQKYFTEKGLKQPFEQVWEPVADATLVKPGRYDGCTIPLYMLMNREKHGIVMEGQSRITLAGCSAGLKLVEGHHDWVNNDFEITDFRFEKYTRQVNHIVVHLDKGTVAGRIRKDDISAARWFDRFTLAQITDFIRLAQESNAVNVLAQLLEYKNTHFSDFDPMDEFTLEW